MKPEDFEQKLQRQPMRQVPAEWREQVLGACVQKETVAEETVVPVWRLFFARFPVAWGAFAALWVVLVSINVLLAASDTPGAPGQVAASSFQSLTVWTSHSATLQQLASDDQSMDAQTPAQPPVMKLKSPRSERQRDWQLREVLCEPTATA
jgi:hypothetical protein